MQRWIPCAVIALLLLCGALVRPTLAIDLARSADNSRFATRVGPTTESSWVRPQDQLWIVSTRGLPEACCLSQDTSLLEVRQSDRAQGWTDSNAESLFSAHVAGQITVVYVHGNRQDWCDAIERGLSVYRSITCSQSDSTPIRFLIWSWPSERTRGQLQDIRIKAMRTEDEFQYLAWFLTRVPSETPVSLIGYSFGARIIVGALHTLAAGELRDRSMIDHSNPRYMRVVLIAAAMHNNWLAPGNRLGKALPLIDQTLIVYNSCDPILKHYQLVEPGILNRIQALGYTGLRSPLDPETATRVRQLDVSRFVGRTHDELRYIESSTIFGRVRRYVLWEPIE